MIIGPAGRLGPITTLVDDGGKILADVLGNEGAVGFAEYPKASFVGDDAVGHEDIADMMTLQFSDDGDFLLVAVILMWSKKINWRVGLVFPVR